MREMHPHALEIHVQARGGHHASRKVDPKVGELEELGRTARRWKEWTVSDRSERAESKIHCRSETDTTMGGVMMPEVGVGARRGGVEAEEDQMLSSREQK